MCHSTRSRAPVAIAVGLLLLIVPAGAVAQSIDVAALDGNWVRHGSNYDPNDQMRIQIAGGSATLLRVPATVHRSFKVGQSLWMAMTSSGTLRVRGSDGQYHPARLTLNGSDELHVAVGRSAAGNDQVWRRAGPTVDGEWVWIDPREPGIDGIRVFADQDHATVRYLPSAAGRHLRIGSRLWSTISAGGAMKILVAGARYDNATLRLQGADTLWIPPSGAARPQLWVRPAMVEAARAGFRLPADSTS